MRLVFISSVMATSALRTISAVIGSTAGASRGAPSPPALARSSSIAMPYSSLSLTGNSGSATGAQLLAAARGRRLVDGQGALVQHNAVGVVGYRRRDVAFHHVLPHALGRALEGAAVAAAAPG